MGILPTITSKLLSAGFGPSLALRRVPAWTGTGRSCTQLTSAGRVDSMESGNGFLAKVACRIQFSCLAALRPDE